MDHVALLEKSQGLKIKLIDKLTKDGEEIPVDKEGAELLLKALHALDHTTMGDRRLNIEAASSDSSKQVNEEFLRLMRQGGNVDPFAAQAGETIPDAPPSVSRDELPPRVMVPGEDHIGPVSETADEFVKRMGGK